MEIIKAKEKVITAGKRLIEKGLIARTWGNISCRINDNQFVITPSGKPYETLTVKEIVIVNINDCSYEGSIEPSSEKKVHAAVYQQRPDINFVIHTHQPYSSAVSPLGTDITVSDPAAADLLGTKVISIPYALSGTEKLKKNVAEAISYAKGKAYLIVSHGALCLGQDCEETFNIAFALEHICADYINHRYLELSGENTFVPEALRDFFIKISTGKSLTNNTSLTKLFNSERIENGFRLHLEASETEPFPSEAQYMDINYQDQINTWADEGHKLALNIHNELYEEYPEINAIIHTLTPDIVAVSCTGQTVYPMLDDFAQIIGVDAPSVDLNSSDNSKTIASDIAQQLKERGAVMLKELGALCCGPNKSDAGAAEIILDKNCRAVIATTLFSKGKPINPHEARIMRKNYLNSYSKKAEA